jgi:DNA-binding Lrp family transcriptional regulator
MSYRRLIPSVLEYAQKFKRLDFLDLKIVEAMHREDIHNLRRLAKSIGAPQQTVSYHVRRFDREDLVRFRALINEPKLGLKSYSVLASGPIGREDASGSALTCFPLWRYLAIIDGWKLGNYVRYAVPPDKERDLVAFLNELRVRDLISDFEVFATVSPKYPLLNLNFYAKSERLSVFDWQTWVQKFDSFEKETLEEPDNYGRAEFDLIDLMILRCLELNARTTQRKIVEEIRRTLGEKNGKKFIPMVSRRIRKTINPQGLITGYRAYLFPNQERTVLLFLFYVAFSNTSSLEAFAAALKHIPYNTSYEKISGKDAMFVRMALPAYECAGMRKSLTTLAQEGHIKDAHLMLGELAHGTWDNVEIYQMFKEDAWNFSFGTAVEMLEKMLHKPVDKK